MKTDNMALKADKAQQKIKPNGPCPCGSKRKAKRCCLRARDANKGNTIARERMRRKLHKIASAEGVSVEELTRLLFSAKPGTYAAEIRDEMIETFNISTKAPEEKTT